MQYTQFKKVIELDHQITTLHGELSKLHAMRAMFAGTSHLTGFRAKGVLATIPNKDPFSEPWLLHTYSYLSTAWAIHGIDIPPLSKIGKKLLKAGKLIESFDAVDAMPVPGMGILLVPPSSLLRFPLASNMRTNQPFVSLPDYSNPDLIQATMPHKQVWQVLVVHTGPVGLDLGSAANILKTKKYIINGNDSRALGLREYAALTLQCSTPIDQGVWTVLLAGTSANSRLVPSVTFLKGQYRFELDEPNSTLGDERFRPAIEIKG